MVVKEIKSAVLSPIRGGRINEDDNCYVLSRKKNNNRMVTANKGQTVKATRGITSPKKTRESQNGMGESRGEVINAPSVRTKKVSFHSVEVYSVLSRKEYTSEEKVATWYTVDQFLSMRDGCLKLAKQMDGCGIALPTTEDGIIVFHDDVRGLERVIKRNLKKQAARRRTLMDELAFLRKHGYHHCSPEDLSTLFQSYTARSMVEARGIGREDEKRARECYSKDRAFMETFFKLFGGNALLLRSSSATKIAPSLKKPNNENDTKETKPSRPSKRKNRKPNKGEVVRPTSATNDPDKGKFRDEISDRLVAARSIR